MPEPTVWRILCVDDDTTITRQVKEFFDGEQVREGSDSDVFEVDVINDFGQALRMLEKTRYDAIIIDLRLGEPTSAAPAEEAGESLLREIQARRFLPVIFYTGLPGLVQGHQGTLIRVVEKTEAVDRLLEEVRTVFARGLPRLNRLLIRRVEDVQREYMWNFVGRNWDRIGGDRDHGTELAYLLARRLAAALSDPGLGDLSAELAGESGTSGDQFHPVRVYLMPPISPVHMPGELLLREVDGEQQYRILLTPACDMVQCKADFFLVARCVPVTGTPEFTKWASSPSGNNRANLKRLLGNKLERFYFLPAALDVPDLIVDFQQLETFEIRNLAGWTRVAILDSPFAQAFLGQFGRYFGRLGTPDVDVDSVIDRLGPQRAASESGTTGNAPAVPSPDQSGRPAEPGERK